MISKFFGIFLIICLVTVGAFALSAMGTHGHSGGSLCPVSTMNGGSGCIADIYEDVLASVFYHISGVHELTHGIGGTGIDISLLVLLFFATVIVLRIFSLNFDIPFSLLSYQRRRKMYEYIARYWEPLLKWISLRNKREPLVYVREHTLMAQ